MSRLLVGVAAAGMPAFGAPSARADHDEGGGRFPSAGGDERTIP